MNDDEVVIRRGLDDNDEVLLTPPADKQGIETVRLPGSGDKPKNATGDTAETAKPVPVKPNGAGAAPSAAPGAPIAGNGGKSVRLDKPKPSATKS